MLVNFFNGKGIYCCTGSAVLNFLRKIKNVNFKVNTSSCLFLMILSLQNAYADNTSYILIARQKNLLQNLDRVADMAANTNTSGFKAENDVFTELDKRTSRSEKLTFPMIGKTTRDISQGNMEVTERQLDVAINGRGYFMISTPYGDMYTRSGSFSLNSDGLLVNQDGYFVSGPSGGQIEFTDKDISIAIGEDGIITSNGEERGQIGVFDFDDHNALERVGKNLFRSKQQAKPAENYKLAQGMLENSNISSVKSMTDLVTVSRAIENVQNLSTAHNDLQLNMIRQLSK